MILGKLTWRTLRKLSRFCGCHWLSFATLLSLIISLVSIFKEIFFRKSPQQLSYRVLCILPLIEAFDIEISNTGTNNIWYGSPEHRPDKAFPFYIETMPPVMIINAHIIRGKVDDNGFQLVKDDEWRYGRVECKWRRLSSGESVVARIIYIKIGKAPDICLTGELKECLLPKKLKPHRNWKPSERLVFIMRIMFVSVIIPPLLGRLYILAWMRRIWDIKILRSLDLPKGIAPSVLVYWRLQVHRRFRFRAT